MPCALHFHHLHTLQALGSASYQTESRQQLRAPLCSALPIDGRWRSEQRPWPHQWHQKALQAAGNPARCLWLKRHLLKSSHPQMSQLISPKHPWRICSHLLFLPWITFPFSEGFFCLIFVWFWFFDIPEHYHVCQPQHHIPLFPQKTDS